MTKRDRSTTRLVRIPVATVNRLREIMERTRRPTALGALIDRLAFYELQELKGLRGPSLELDRVNPIRDK